ncbi:MAG: hypothetical protein RIC87_12875 [Kiloniellales bacterium]
MPARQTLRQLQSLLAADPSLTPKFEAAKEVVRAFRRPAFYEVSQRCNLFCEGCYYFEGPTAFQPRNAPEVETWRAFFEKEAKERKVSMAYFIGAEPSLEPERLYAAKDFFTYGNIGTNGVVKIDKEIPFRISISVWGDPATDVKLRGADAFKKALANYGEDPRALVVYTLSAWNLEAAREVAVKCRDHGLPLTFNMYTPTAPYLDKVDEGAKNDKAYFRLSKKGSTPCFDAESLVACRNTVRDLMDAFPETIVYTDHYNAWATQAGSMFHVDEDTGIASNCGSRIIGTLKYMGADLNARDLKCCTPDVDCRDCRMYSAGWSTRLQLLPADVASAKSFQTWCDDISALGKIFVYRPETGAPSGQEGMASFDRLASFVSPS